MKRDRDNMDSTDGLPNPLKEITRRHFFKHCGSGLGALALTGLMNEKLFAAEAPTTDALAVRPPHFTARAKRIIYLHMAGAPSQLDLFDPKPALAKYNGQAIPEEFTKGDRFAFIKTTPRILGSPHKFNRYGPGGMDLSDLLPQTAKIADDLCFVRSMHTDQFNHAPAQLFVHTGSQLQGRPSFGSWVTYGLGSENRDLPGFVVLLSGPSAPDGGSALWSSGFLPTVYQGTQFRSQGEPVLHVSNPPGVSPQIRRQSLDALRDLNQARLSDVGDPEIATRIAQYELAYRMQTSVPELTEIANEPSEIHALYGTTPGKTSFANNCLLARRLAERGVRFIQLYHWGWDTHGTGEGDDLLHSLPKRCMETDRASAALITDLKQRGLLDSTLVIWGGEFGRTPMNEGRNNSTFLGRDHHPHAFTIWMAGGGIKPGLVYGETDELGYKVARDGVHVHDFQTTVLHCLGLDHKRLTYKFQGRDFRLTDVYGELVPALLA